MTPGRKFSTSASRVRTRRRRTSLPRACLRLTVSDRLPAFCARNDTPISATLSVGVGAELAREVAAVGHLDLDHVRAQVRELMRAERSGEHVGEVDDAQACKRPGPAGVGHFLPLATFCGTEPHSFGKNAVPLAVVKNAREVSGAGEATTSPRARRNPVPRRPGTEARRSAQNLPLLVQSSVARTSVPGVPFSEASDT